MKNCCVICGIPLEEYEADLCETCFRFFYRDYPKDLKRRVARFKFSNKQLDEWNNNITEKEVKK